ncbi:MAG TPA: hypothetical protein VEU96_11515 [Bryobacteraceae bacterium]|nr:hypothetical protein [Bryobacteraceae bacterium]
MIHWLPIILAILSIQTSQGQTLILSPLGANFTAEADTPNPGQLQIQTIGIGTLSGDPVHFEYHAALPSRVGDPNFIVVSPSSGTTPATVFIALNPNVVPFLHSGSYSLVLQFAVAGQSSPPYAGIPVSLRLSAQSAPSITGVVSAASLRPDISPGQIVSIFGARLGTQPVTAQFDATGLYPTDLSHLDYTGTNVRDGVTFNGLAAPLLYISPSQINAVVPYGVAGQTAVDVIVTHNLNPSPRFTVPIADTSPGIFTFTQNGTGQGAILNTNGSPNSVDNPAPKRSVIQIFASGAGLWKRTPPSELGGPVLDGSVILDAFNVVPVALVSLTIGGQPAQIFYAGAAPVQISGLLQVNALVPANIGSGRQPVVLTIGQGNNAQQQVSVAVQ